MMHLGVDGYLENAEKALSVTKQICGGVGELEGIKIITPPVLYFSLRPLITFKNCLIIRT